MSPNSERISLMCESSCSAAVLQSSARWVGVGEGAGVGGDAGAEGKAWDMVEGKGLGLVGVMMGRGGWDRDMRDCLRT